MTDLRGARKAIREAGLDGWLFYNQFHRDEISDFILGVPRDVFNTRPWLCILFPGSQPLKIVHTIEAGALSHLPGETVTYATRAELAAALTRALPSGALVAAQYSTRFPVSSFLDHGTALLIEGCGVRLASSDELIVECLGALDAAGIASHERASAVLHAAVAAAWDRLASAARGGQAVHEGDVQGWIASFISEKGLESDGPPLVASGRGTANPHYSSQGRGELIRPGDVVQFDIWAKEPAPGAVFADISWAGVLATRPDPAVQQVFEAVCAAREAALSCISAALEQGRGVSGADADRAARERIISLGFERGIRHRTGHSIGARIHGFGVNLDSIEFPDDRLMREGSCFSVEPGIYLQDLGMRTEIDAYINGGRLVVSGGERQRRLLVVE